MLSFTTFVWKSSVLDFQLDHYDSHPSQYLQ